MDVDFRSFSGSGCHVSVASCVSVGTKVSFSILSLTLLAFLSSLSTTEFGMSLYRGKFGSPGGSVAGISSSTTSKGLPN